MNRTYGNGLIQQFSYDEENNRLTNIYISGVQNLTYDYDSVENIISILDPVNNRNHYLGYDGLNRLINATIGDDVYKYSYNPLGNMMKIVHNNERFFLKPMFVPSGVSIGHSLPRCVECNSRASKFSWLALNGLTTLCR